MAIAHPEAVCLRAQMADAPIGKQNAGVWVMDVAEFEGAACCVCRRVPAPAGPLSARDRFATTPPDER
jgi:hypothetical protein